MAAISEATLAASVIVGLLSIPVVSETGTPTGAFSGELPNISTSDSIPREVTTSTSPESFRRTVETAFDEFSAVIDSRSSNLTLENPGSQLRVERNPTGTRWTLKTASGTLELSKTPAEQVERVSTPDGTLVRTESGGGVTERFRGADRESVEQRRSELRQLLDQKKEKLDRHAAEMRTERYEGRVDLNVSSGADGKEYAVIHNRMDAALDLDGWTLSDEAGSFEFGSVSVPADGRLYAYTDDVEPVDSGAVNVYETGIAWNDDGDTATLRDPGGNEVASYGY